MTTGFRVFVVDDESVIASSLGVILRLNGFVAESFTNPLEALTAAIHQAPHLLISDVAMPQMSGVDLAIHMMALCPKCKVLLFSGQASTNDLLHEARKAGYDFELLQKPVHPNDLLAAIREQNLTFAD